VTLSAHTPAFEARQGKCEASRIAALPFAATAYQALLFLNASRRPLALGDRDEPRPLKDVHEHLIVCLLQSSGPISTPDEAF
jgi:hypothetical protein